jgi:hypothetical protein
VCLVSWRALTLLHTPTHTLILTLSDAIPHPPVTPLPLFVLPQHDLLNRLFKVADASKVLLQHVKARLRDHLVVAEPIEVTHTLQQSSSCSVEMAAAPSRGRGTADPVASSLPQSASARRPGWRVFNIEVCGSLIFLLAPALAPALLH